jgi:prepilin-type N-terminal cleavage/methylation domain-containing protein
MIRQAGGTPTMENQIEIVPTNDKGFSLVELLIVIVILGILATVTVFAVTGISDRGKTNGCKADRHILQTAEEAFNANTASAGTYGTQAQLKASGLIHSASANFTIAIGAGTGAAASYTITGLGPNCVGING